MKQCLNCESEFVSKYKEAKFCSRSCAATVNNRGVRRNYVDGSSIDNVTLRCYFCKEFIGSNRKYCSIICQHKYKRVQRVEDSSASLRTLKSFLIDKNGNKCEQCGWCEVNQYSGKIPIELDHIDGNSENNSLENLRLLCPNCHSLTRNI